MSIFVSCHRIFQSYTHTQFICTTSDPSYCFLLTAPIIQKYEFSSNNPILVYVTGLPSALLVATAAPVWDCQIVQGLQSCLEVSINPPLIFYEQARDICTMDVNLNKEIDLSLISDIKEVMR